MKKIYNNDYPSVTNVLDCLRKKGLEFYFQYNTPEFLKAESKKNLSIGTISHDVIANHIEKTKIEIETDYPEEVETALKSFMLFKKEHPEIKLKKSETPLTSEKYKYNGTLDCVGYINDLIIFDWKTGKCYTGTKKEVDIPKIYDDYIYQVSAYVIAYNEVMKANVRQAGIVAIAKDKVAYNYLLLTEKTIKESFNEVFLSALKIFYHKQKEKEESKNGETKQRISSTPKGINSNSKGSKKHSKPSRKLPDSF